jgi:hypothetical protein
MNNQTHNKIRIIISRIDQLKRVVESIKCTLAEIVDDPKYIESTHIDTLNALINAPSLALECVYQTGLVSRAGNQQDGLQGLTDDSITFKAMDVEKDQTVTVTTNFKSDGSSKVIETNKQKKSLSSKCLECGKRRVAVDRNESGLCDDCDDCDEKDRT